MTTSTIRLRPSRPTEEVGSRYLKYSNNYKVCKPDGKHSAEAHQVPKIAHTARPIFLFFLQTTQNTANRQQTCDKSGKNVTHEGVTYRVTMSNTAPTKPVTLHKAHSTPTLIGQ